MYKKGPGSEQEKKIQKMYFFARTSRNPEKIQQLNNKYKNCIF